MKLSVKDGAIDMLKSYTMFPMGNGKFVRMEFFTVEEEYDFLQEYLPQDEVAYCLCYYELIGYYYFDKVKGFTYKSF